ncbi:MAG TPA: hypothetical protein VGM98_16690, partial [Schlesneria sp.]
MPPHAETESQERDDEIIGKMFWRSILVFAGLTLVVAIAVGGWWLTNKKNKIEVVGTKHVDPSLRSSIEVPDIPFR